VTAWRAPRRWTEGATSVILSAEMQRQPSIEEYRRGWERRCAELIRAAAERAARARSALPAIVEALVALGATRIVLFGSLATGRFGLDSDIDLAVEGIENELRAAIAAERVAPEFTVDIVPLERTFAHVKDRIPREGVVLHGKP
jgi:predicted nucleotidyltransferase